MMEHYRGLIDAGWTVFIEADSALVWVGLYKNPGMGIEGVPYCDLKWEAPTIEAAIEMAWEYMLKLQADGQK